MGVRLNGVFLGYRYDGPAEADFGAMGEEEEEEEGGEQAEEEQQQQQQDVKATGATEET